MKTPPIGNLAKIDRRAFLRATGIAGGGLILGFLGGCDEDRRMPRPPADSGVFYPNAFLRIDMDGVFIYAPNPEVGQGVKTSLPMIVAEELDVAWEQVQVVQADIDRQWYGRQMAEGSRSIALAWQPLREAGATGRRMLIEAAAQQWQVAAEECQTRDGVVYHDGKGRQAAYQSLAQAASELSVPDLDRLTFKRTDQYRILGNSIGGVDNPSLVRGESLFSIDHSLPDMLHATFVKCPTLGGDITWSNEAELRTMAGVVDVFVIEGNGAPDQLSTGVAIVAEDTWTAMKARDALKVNWDLTNASTDSLTELREKALQIADQDGEQILLETGSVDQVFSSTDRKVSAVYEYPFLSHAQMEPQSASAWWRDGRMEVWNATQAPHRAVGGIARALGLERDAVVMHQLRAGGGFGRGHRSSVSVEAAAIAIRVAAPVKLTWTRQDDMAHDFYRAAGFHSFRGAVDESGRLAAWSNHFITLTVNGERPVSGGRIHPDRDPAPFLENYRVTQTMIPWSTPCGPWRAPESNGTAFAQQCFLCELADLAQRDHLEFLLELIGESRWLKKGDPRAFHTGRAAGVIRLAAQQADWGRQMPDGEGLGLAFYFSHAAYVANVAHVSVKPGRRLSVRRVTVAADVGPIVNMSGARHQVEGSVVDALSSLLGQEVTFEEGRAQQSNFHEYPILRRGRIPEVDVHFIQSEFPPTGLGEPAFPPVTPAIVNAIHAATGERVRRLPISSAGFS